MLKKIILSPNPYRDRGFHAAQAAEEILIKQGIQVVYCLPFRTDNCPNLPPHIKLKSLLRETESADMIICFGGDGTILHTSKTATAARLPLLGINMGSVGFMTELEQGELSQLEKLGRGEYTIEARMMLRVRVLRQGKAVFSDLALNDAVIGKGAVARVLDLSVKSDEILVTQFGGDGLVVSTPTGSTAYSMAAGGPIVEPNALNIIVTPICAHMLGAKSFVLDRARVVTVELNRLLRKSAYLSVDGGRAFKLEANDVVELSRAKEETHLVRILSRSFYEIVSYKLGAKRGKERQI